MRTSDFTRLLLWQASKLVLSFSEKFHSVLPGLPTFSMLLGACWEPRALVGEGELPKIQSRMSQHRCVVPAPALHTWGCQRQCFFLKRGCFINLHHETPPQPRFNVQNMGHAAFPWEVKVARNSVCTHLIDELKTSALAGIFLPKRAFPWIFSPSSQDCNVMVFLKKPTGAGEAF